MNKFVFLAAVLTMTACTSAKSEVASTDSTMVQPAETTVYRPDTTVRSDTVVKTDSVVKF